MRTSAKSVGMSVDLSVGGIVNFVILFEDGTDH